MGSFRKQIDEDIKEYQDSMSNVVNEMKKSEWAFNYWILDKFFYEEDELIVDKITDYNDDGIDCYEWYEDTKELYLIQNKYYDETTKLPLSYIQNTFLITPIAVLENGTYARSQELQSIYSKNKDDEQFTVHLQLYITNDQIDEKALEEVRKFNGENGPRRTAQIFYLTDIETKWYGEAKKSSKTFTTTVESVNKGTILTINNEAYKLDTIIDARYVFTPVTCIYRMVKEAKEKKYSLFEKNIREYLGNKGINKRIYETLKDPEERKNFFYYNNGITIICSGMDALTTLTHAKRDNIAIEFKIHNPQIVNGCQTVNSIFNALEGCNPDDLEKQYRDSFVMLKILQIDLAKPEQKKLSKNIVTYNNSQNSLDEKTFEANNEIFSRIKNEFKKKGFLLLTRQSDAETYATEYKKKSDFYMFKALSEKQRDVFGLEAKKIKDVEIPLEKLLQVILAYKCGGLQAFTLKKDVLKQGTPAYNYVTEFIKSTSVTTEVLLQLYLLFMRFEKEKNANSASGKYLTTTPISFYAVDGFRRYECKDEINNILTNLSASLQIDKMVKIYTATCKAYTDSYLTKYSTLDYTKMIKADIDYTILEQSHSNATTMYNMMSN